jgi:hypothetical protein
MRKGWPLGRLFSFAAGFFDRNFLEFLKIGDYFRFIFAYTVFMPQDPKGLHPFVVRCKGCDRNFAAPVETMPASWIAVKCPMCGEHRRYLPAEIFQGRVSWERLPWPVGLARRAE